MKKNTHGEHAALRRMIGGGAGMLLAGLAWGQPAEEAPPELERVVISATRTHDLLGLASTSSQGLVTMQELALRPVYRVGQLLESVPGLVVTAHSGDGKANQFLLRGFNLDHGTDLATYIDGMPVNGRTHTHGQGYTDVNFLIPELAGGIDFTKGPYFAAEGDFSSVGTTRIKYRDVIENQIAVTAGSLGERRLFGGGMIDVAKGKLLAAVEAVRLDGPWDSPDNVRKYNAVLRYSQGNTAEGSSLTAMSYRNRWNATTDQPQRAVSQGLIGRFGTLDPSDGGRAERHSLSGRHARFVGDWHLKANAYAIRSGLTLWNNFTHLLDDPVNGDQHGQNDRRTVLGGELNISRAGRLLGRDNVTTFGLQSRNDAIDVDLLHTVRRKALSVDRHNRVRENSIGLYAEAAMTWTPWLRSVVGARGDYFHTRDTDLAVPANSGLQSRALFQPKLNLILMPWEKTELYFSAGTGFHSNDARSGLDESGLAYVRPPLLVKSRGSEIGIRSTYLQGLDLSATAFRIDFDSELIYNGDAGATEAGRPSHRTGVELSAQYRPLAWLACNANVAMARARYRDGDPAGNHIEDAPDLVASAGILIDGFGPWSGALTFRKLGPHALTNDNSERSGGYAVWTAAIGYRIMPSLHVRFDIFNLLNAKTNAADYFYTSRLPGEAAAGIDDRHSHPLEPRSVRLTLTKTF